MTDREVALLQEELRRTQERLEQATRDLDAVGERHADDVEREARRTAELQRRLTNMLAVIRSIFSRTLTTADTFEDVAYHFRGRLDSFARTQVAILRAPRQSVELEDLLRDELMTFGLTDCPRLRVEGPAVLLPRQVAEVFGLALHEMATNAAKFGMLAQGEGRLEVRWSVTEADAGRRLTFIWRETDVAMAASAPARQGFGRDLIEVGLPYQIGATTAFELLPDGLRCVIELPLPAANMLSPNEWTIQ